MSKEIIHDTNSIMKYIIGNELEYLEEEFEKHKDIIDVNYIYENYRTPLMIACDFLYLDGIEFFISYGADKYLTDNEGNTALTVVLNKFNSVIERIKYYKHNKKGKDISEKFPR